VNKLFYPRLAAQNIRKNGKFYFPYLLTAVGTVMMFYIMCSLASNPGITDMPGSAALASILWLGTIVIGLFAIIFLYYTNSFLIKRRKKELGLYNILGMEKRHIAVILGIETIYTALIGIGGGLVCGVVFNKLVMMLLSRMMNFTQPIKFEVSITALVTTLILFGLIFALILISDIARITISNPIELLRGGNVGEREPKTKLIMTILGVLCLGVGYYIAITTESPISALALFFVAVILVIAGTYLLFTAGSIAVLKLLRSNKGYYYKTKHFIPVSGMIYRMKQNAVGLSNICILSTMVLVMVSGTLCMYLGTDDAIASLYPHDITIKTYMNMNSPDVITVEKFHAAVNNICTENGVTPSYHASYAYVNLTAYGKNGVYTADGDMTVSAVRGFYIMTAEDYTALTDVTLTLSDGECAVYDIGSSRALEDSFTLFGSDYKIIKRIAPLSVGSGATVNLYDSSVIIVADTADMAQAAQSGSAFLIMNGDIDTDLSDSDNSAFSSALHQGMEDAFADENEELHFTYVCRADNKAEFYGLYGGFFFLGVFLGTLFIMATVLIIYYKQISEGYDDKERFNIMQKVGMSHSEVRSCIRSQVVTVFFLPLAAAALHIAAAFKMITRLLLLFSLTNVTLFALTTLATVFIFALIYAAVYALTAKVYYKIVG